MVNAN